MSASSRPTILFRSSPRKATAPSQVPPNQKSETDWLGPALLTAKAITAGAECVPFPYVKGAFGTVVILLETVEKVKKNHSDLKELCSNALQIMAIVQDQITLHGEAGAEKMRDLCQKFESSLQEIVLVAEQLQHESKGFRGHVKEMFKTGSIAEKIAGYQQQMQRLQSNCMFAAGYDTNAQVHKILKKLNLLEISQGNIPILYLATRLSKFLLEPTVTQPNKPINDCPPLPKKGRQAILDEIHNYFTQNLGMQHVYLLYGLAGAGKTQIALEFIDNFSTHFSRLFMIDASTTETIDEGLKDIATITKTGPTSQDALQWLTDKDEKWLILFDNADDPKINLQTYFPKCNHGNILIASRNPELCVHAGSFSQVSGMEEEVAVNLLLKTALQDDAPENRRIAGDIVKVLKYFPLAIIQAGAFIAKSRDLGNYLALYSVNQAQLSEKPGQSYDDYARTVYTTCQINFCQLTPVAADFLQLCSFVHYAGISEDMFSQIFNYDFPESGPSKEELEPIRRFISNFGMPTGGWDSLRFTDMINEIKGYSLIKPDLQKGGLPATGIAATSLRWMPHVDALLSTEMYGPDFRAQFSRVYWEAGSYEKAKQLTIMVVEKLKEVLDSGGNDPDTLMAMQNLARTYWKLGQLKDAEELAAVGLERSKQLLGNNHPNTLSAMQSLAFIYQDLGQFKDAQELQFFVLEKEKQIQGEDHPATQGAMQNLANTYRNLGHLKEAEELEIVILEKRKQLLGEDHPDTLTAMYNLALTYSTLGQFKEAEELGLIVLKKRKQILGEDHSDTLAATGVLALMYKTFKKLDKAQELDVVILEKKKQILGEDHPDTLSAMYELARTYIQSKKCKEAEALQIVLLEKRKQILGKDHPETLDVMHHLAITYHNLGQSESAIAFFNLKKAKELELVVLEKREKILGEDHPDTLGVMHDLAITYYCLGQWKEAEELQVVLFEKQKKLFGTDHPKTLHAQQNLAKTHRSLGKLKEAQKLEIIEG
ncbi:hypothetical protein DFH09DRAFT_1108736 [Mycena vulgaris]|nr:hypothetical protein DFH09DRAFT_1108736 [Mycena vulgaris]